MESQPVARAKKLDYVEPSRVSTPGEHAVSKKVANRKRAHAWIWWLIAGGLVVALIVANIFTPRAPIVTVETATEQNLVASFTAEAYVQGKNYEMSPQSPGRIIRLFVNEGDQVRTGQLLFQVDDSQATAILNQAKSAEAAAAATVLQATAQLAAAEHSASAQLAAAESGLRGAIAKKNLIAAGARVEEIAQAQQRVDEIKANLENLQVSYARAESLYKQGAISKANAEAAEAAYKAARAQLGQANEALRLLKAGPRKEELEAAKADVAAAQANVSLAKSAQQEVATRRQAVAVAEAQLAGAKSAVQADQAALNMLSVKAPTDGSVSKLHQEQGTQATPGISVLTLSTRQNLRIDAEISSEDAAKAKVGMKVVVTSPAYPGQEFPAKLISLSPVGELKPQAAIQTRIVRARVQIDKDWALFRPGMEVDVEGQTTLKKALLVPGDALVLSGSETSVWILKSDGTVTKLNVQTGFSNATQTEILAGLKGGESVVVEGKDNLKEGQKVKVRT